jgi:energy-coupling factor transport system ATP-binding protein
MKTLIELEHVSYAYILTGGARVPALVDVSLRIAAGEYVALVGANGSGKSTLARHLNALLVPNEGRVVVEGHDTRDRAAHPEIRRTVGMVFQRPDDQIVASVVEEDVAFGPENLGLSPEEIDRRVQDALALMDIAELRQRPPHLLSAGQMQRLAVAGVMALRPRCLVFDEATAMLDPQGRREVRALMRRLHDEGYTIIAITHFMDEALDAERVLVLREGRIAWDTDPQTLFAAPERLQRLGLTPPPAASLAYDLRDRLPALPENLVTVPQIVDAVDALPHRRTAAPPLPETVQDLPEDAFIRVQDLAHTYLRGTPLASRALTDVDCAVRERSGHGLIGATGSGKSTLMQHLNGLLRPQAGSVRVGRFDLNDPELDVRTVRRTVGLAFQRPETQIFAQYVGDEIAYGPRLQGVTGEALRERVRWAMGLVGLDFAAFKDRLTFALSGGERRKVALAAILALRPEVLLLDEPTAGLDPVSRLDLLAHLRELRGAGLTLFVSSHQMEDLAVLTEQLTVLARGSSILSGPTPTVFAHAERLQSLGLDVPVATAVAAGLRRRGWRLPASIVTAPALGDALAAQVRHG